MIPLQDQAGLHNAIEAAELTNKVVFLKDYFSNLDSQERARMCEAQVKGLYERTCPEGDMLYAVISRAVLDLGELPALKRALSLAQTKAQEIKIRAEINEIGEGLSSNISAGDLNPYLDMLDINRDTFYRYLVKAKLLDQLPQQTRH